MGLQEVAKWIPRLLMEPANLNSFKLKAISIGLAFHLFTITLFWTPAIANYLPLKIQTRGVHL